MTLGGKTKGDGSDRVVHKKHKVNEKLYFCQQYEFQTILPGASQLVVQIKDWNLVGRNQLIGQTSIDLETRYFCNDWHQLGRGREVDSNECKKPTEKRKLTLPDSLAFRGSLEMWVDIFEQQEKHLYPHVDISRPPNVAYELRVIIWQAKDMIAMDSGGKNDLFISGKLVAQVSV
eukprot:SAG31_NODE_4670_length_3046_cov_1.967424_5_plen_175_part_00